MVKAEHELFNRNIMLKDSFAIKRTFLWAEFYLIIMKYENKLS